MIGHFAGSASDQADLVLGRVAAWYSPRKARGRVGAGTRPLLPVLDLRMNDSTHSQHTTAWLLDQIKVGDSQARTDPVARIEPLFSGLHGDACPGDCAARKIRRIWSS